MIEIQDCWTDPAIREIVFMKPARIGSTAATLNIFGRILDVDPGPVLWLWPDLEAARKFSELELEPMCRDTVPLRHKITDDQPNKRGNKILRKKFPGGFLILVGANSPAGLAQVTIQHLFCDEVDRYGKSAGKEGDPIELAKRRTTTFTTQAKVFLGSSPTVKGKSRIETAYRQSDQRIFEVPCPHCDTFQELTFKQLKWDSPAPEDLAYYVCIECAGVIEAKEKDGLVAKGRWKATAPFTGVAGFRISGLVSPWWTWDEIKDRFLKAKTDPEQLKVFINTILGELWDDEESMPVAIADLVARQAEYHLEAPDGVLCVTAGCDVQHNRIEITVTGWGVNNQTWILDHIIVWGDPLEAEVWREVERHLLKKYTASHAELAIEAAFVDAGDGNRTAEVYAFCHRQNRKGRKWYACKGSQMVAKPILSKPTRQGREKTIHWEVGTNTIKDTLDAMLKVTQPGQNYIHFPAWNPDRYANFAEEYFCQLRGEQPVEEIYRGRPYNRWKKIRKRNEALDCLVYSRAALAALNINFADREKTRLASLTPEPNPQPAPEPNKTVVLPRRSKFRQRWK